jgi:branched-chain amino acid transport system permease protein
MKSLGEFWQNHKAWGFFIGAILFFPILITDNYYIHMAITVGLLAYLAMTWNIVGGLAGHVSFGHATFVGVGAYTSTLLFSHYGLTPWLGMIAGGLLSVLFGVLVGFPCFRLRGPFFSLATLALAEVVRIYVMNTENLGPFEVRGAAGILVPLKGDAPGLFQFNDKIPYYYIIWAMILLVYYISYRIRMSQYGLFLTAIADDEEAARANGVNVLKVKMIALMASAFLAAIGGTFYAQFYRSVDPVNVLSVGFSMEMVLMAVVGGTKILHGPIIGTLILAPIGEYARATLGGSFFGLHKMIYGAMLVAVILFVPKGISSLPGLLSQRFGRKGRVGERV